MPHIAVKLYPGRTNEQKKALADELTRALIAVLGSKPESISIGIEDVSPDDWAEVVTKPEVLVKSNTIFRQPGTA